MQRVLYLRAFRDDQADSAMISYFATLIGLTFKANQVEGRLIVVGPPEKRRVLEHHWNRLFGESQKQRIWDYVEYVMSLDADWRRQIHYQLDASSAVIFYVSPKDEGERAFRLPQPMIQTGALNTESFDSFCNSIRSYFRSDLEESITGDGLLHELCYLERMDALDKTILVIWAHEYHTLQDAVAVSCKVRDILRFGVGIQGGEGGGFSIVNPRIRSLDKKLEILTRISKAVGIDHQLDIENLPIMDMLAALYSGGITHFLIQVLNSGLSFKQTIEDNGLPLGKSKSWRRVLPDVDEKMIPFSNVEELVFIPTGKIIEVEKTTIALALKPGINERACACCQAELSRLLLFQRIDEAGPAETAPADTLASLRVPGEKVTGDIWAVCQECGADLILRDGQFGYSLFDGPSSQIVLARVFEHLKQLEADST